MNGWIIAVGLFVLGVIMYQYARYTIRNVIYITVNAGNIQRKCYKIKRKDIVSCDFEGKNTYKEKFIVKTKKSVYTFIYKNDISLMKMKEYFDFQNDMNDIFLKGKLNSYKIYDLDKSFIGFEQK